MEYEPVSSLSARGICYEASSRGIGTVRGCRIPIRTGAVAICPGRMAEGHWGEKVVDCVGADKVDLGSRHATVCISLLALLPNLNPAYCQQWS